MDPNALKNAWTQWMSGLAQGGQGPAAQVYREWEQWVGQQFDKLARSETFLGQTAKALEGSFLLKSQFDRALEGSLKAMRMPTSSDLEAVHKRLDALERRLDQIADQLEAQAPKASAKRAAKP